MSKVIKKIQGLRIPSASIKISTSVIAICLIVVAIFILGGGVYDLMENPISVLPTPSQPVFYYSGMTEQTLNESLIFTLFLIMGITGGYLSFRSSRRAYRPREARIFLALGMAMMLIAFIGCEALMADKGI